MKPKTRSCQTPPNFSIWRVHEGHFFGDFSDLVGIFGDFLSPTDHRQSSELGIFCPLSLPQSKKRTQDACISPRLSKEAPRSTSTCVFCLAVEPSPGAENRRSHSMCTRKHSRIASLITDHIQSRVEIGVFPVRIWIGHAVVSIIFRFQPCEGPCSGGCIGHTKNHRAKTTVQSSLRRS